MSATVSWGFISTANINDKLLAGAAEVAPEPLGVERIEQRRVAAGRLRRRLAGRPHLDAASAPGAMRAVRIAAVACGTA